MVRMVGMVMMTNCGRQTLQLGPSHSALTHTWAAPCNDDDDSDGDDGWWLWWGLRKQLYQVDIGGILIVRWATHLSFKKVKDMGGHQEYFVCSSLFKLFCENHWNMLKCYAHCIAAISIWDCASRRGNETNANCHLCKFEFCPGFLFSPSAFSWGHDGGGGNAIYVAHFISVIGH